MHIYAFAIAIPLLLGLVAFPLSQLLVTKKVERGAADTTAMQYMYAEEVVSDFREEAQYGGVIIAFVVRPVCVSVECMCD